MTGNGAGTANVQGRVAIVTGAIKGIGLAIARSLAEAGVRCVLTYYDWLESLPRMNEAMSETGMEYVAVQADLTREEEVDKVVAAAADRFGRLDILVNNIERGGWPAVHGRYVPEQWRLEFDTTVTAKWHLFRKALPWLRRQGGAVVNISSIAGIVGRSGPASLVFNDCYSLANRAVSSMTEQWAREAAPGVRVNELQIGLVDTRHGPGTRGWGVLSRHQRMELMRHTLLERTGTPDEVARAVRFLALDAGFMTGSVVRMDGGYCLGGDRVADMPEGVVRPGESTFGGSVAPGSRHEQ